MAVALAWQLGTGVAAFSTSWFSLDDAQHTVQLPLHPTLAHPASPPPSHPLAVHLCFICVLHLANEHGLVIRSVPELDRLHISNVPQDQQQHQ